MMFKNWPKNKRVTTITSSSSASTILSMSRISHLPRNNTRASTESNYNEMFKSDNRNSTKTNFGDHNNKRISSCSSCRSSSGILSPLAIPLSLPSQNQEIINQHQEQNQNQFLLLSNTMRASSSQMSHSIRKRSLRRPFTLFTDIVTKPRNKEDNDTKEHTGNDSITEEEEEEDTKNLFISYINEHYFHILNKETNQLLEVELLNSSQQQIHLIQESQEAQEAQHEIVRFNNIFCVKLQDLLYNNKNRNENIINAIPNCTPNMLRTAISIITNMKKQNDILSCYYHILDSSSSTPIQSSSLATDDNKISSSLVVKWFRKLSLFLSRCCCCCFCYSRRCCCSN